MTKKIMTKNDLKDGMIVRTLDNALYLIFQDKLIDREGFIRLTMYSDDLRHIYHDDWTITEVYDEQFERLDIAFLVEGANPIWKRCPPVVEMTVSEIEKKLGIENLKVVAEKE